MTIELQGMEAIVKKLESLNKPAVFRRPMTQSVAHLQRKIAKYPIGNQHRPQPFKTDKSRRYFFAALRSGDIEVPYKRGSSPGSEKLATSWTTNVSADGRMGTVGNDASYGPLVQDKARQTAYHKATGWSTVQDVAKKEAKMIIRFFQQAIERALK